MNSLLVVVLLVIRGTGSAHADTPTSATANISAPRIFLCSVEEKECFRVNQVLHKEDGKCYRIGNRGPCSRDREFVALKDAYTRSGRLFGVCQPLLRCDDPNMILMADGSCQPTEGSIYTCPYDESLQSKKNIFGEWECCLPDKCDEDLPAVEQPEDEKYCVTPNLGYKQREERLRNANYSLLGAQFECSDFLEECLIRGVGLLQECRRGWFVVDKDKYLRKNVISVTCQAPLCDLGSFYMAKEVHRSIGCLSNADIHKKLCVEEDVVFNAFGEALCGGAVSQESLLSLPEAREGDCVPPETGEALPAPTSDSCPLCPHFRRFCPGYGCPGCPTLYCPPQSAPSGSGGASAPVSGPREGVSDGGRTQPQTNATEDDVR